MIAVDVIDHVANIRRLLPEKYPNVAIVEGILEGKISGKIWHNVNVDAYLLTTDSPFNFIIGKISDSFLEKSLSLIHKLDSFIVFCNDSKYVMRRALPIQTRLHFVCNPSDIVELPPKIAKRISAQYQLSEVDTVLFESCDWKERLLAFYTTLENFLRFSYGMVALREKKIVSEIFGIIGGSFFEVGAFTNPQYRGFGLVPFVISTIIKPYCISKSLIFSASCGIDNIASEKTIRALGLQKDFEYAVLDVSKIQKGEKVFSSEENLVECVVN